MDLIGAVSEHDFSVAAGLRDLAEGYEYDRIGQLLEDEGQRI
ncbi:MAG: hypothetical protein QF473_03410 [Planctomycetota bacterium]|jgi:hypothetical protein|nr:hypothetical protein [Planctomycetota bacterium]MDP6503704.1 hypothetical protein [Planctomycetota bacterium]